MLTSINLTVCYIEYFEKFTGFHNYYFEVQFKSNFMYLSSLKVR